MGLLANALAPNERKDWAPWDDRWYSSDLGSRTDPFVLSAESILKCGTVLAAVRFLADSWGMCPPQAFKKTERGREEAPLHNVQRVLRRPNLYQTGFRWRHVNMTWVATYGNAPNEIISHGNELVEELRPLHPSRVRVVDQRGDGSLLYEYRPPRGAVRLIGQERMLHFRGISTDGVQGAAIYQLIRNVVAIAQAAERHMGAFLRKGNRTAGLVTPSAPLEPEQQDELSKSLNESLTGLENTGSFGVLPHGVTVVPIASNNREAQLAEIDDRIVGAILRALGVPGVVVGFTGDNTQAYASVKEFYLSGGIKHCVMPYVINFEQECDAALVDEEDHFIKYNLDVLLRADTIERMTALREACGGAYLTVNEARRIDDFNPIEDDGADEIRNPLNTPTPSQEEKAAEKKPAAPAGRPPFPPRPARKAAPADDDDPDAAAEVARLRAYAEQFALDAGVRIVRRELNAIRGTTDARGAAQRFAKDAAGFKTWATTYYERHAAHVAEVLHIDPAAARAYADGQRDALIAGGVAATETWEETQPPRLAALALGEE